MSYLVLARKYRPKTFGDLIGQGQVSHTLTRALEIGRLAHAYLFAGPRGVGKTTAARLLAMSLSCSGQGPKPCGQCPHCLEIQNGQSVDVIEVDGASNRGINEIRSLRDTVKYLPAKNPYKVYIIDEVHALTADAFGALLKTLEEPPSHVVFIFATTEAHKLPATIISRCQRYDFRRIRVDDIAGRLKDVANLESIEFDPEALTVIARQAEGGLRDALGLMDQVIASAGAITLEAVNSALGLINQDLVYRTALASLGGRAAEALKVLEEAYDLGYDFKELGQRVLELIRDLTMFKAGRDTAEFLDLTDAEESRFLEITKSLSLATLHRHLEAWLRFQNELSRHPQPRWLMEAHLIRLGQMAPLADLAQLAERLTAFLESGGAPQAAKPGPPARSDKAPLSSALGPPIAPIAPVRAAPPAPSAPSLAAPQPQAQAPAPPPEAPAQAAPPAPSLAPAQVPTPPPAPLQPQAQAPTPPPAPLQPQAQAPTPPQEAPTQPAPPAPSLAPAQTAPPQASAPPPEPPKAASTDPALAPQAPQAALPDPAEPPQAKAAEKTEAEKPKGKPKKPAGPSLLAAVPPPPPAKPRPSLFDNLSAPPPPKPSEAPPGLEAAEPEKAAAPSVEAAGPSSLEASAPEKAEAPGLEANAAPITEAAAAPGQPEAQSQSEPAPSQADKAPAETRAAPVAQGPPPPPSPLAQSFKYLREANDGPPPPGDESDYGLGPDPSLISRLEAASMAQEKRAILEGIPVIKRLKEELPGQFLGYFDTPVSDASSESEANDESALAQGGEAPADHGPAGEEDDF